jgi:hypothetical protein
MDNIHTLSVILGCVIFMAVVAIAARTIRGLLGYGEWK